MLKRFRVLFLIVAFSITVIGQDYSAEIEEFEAFAKTEMAAQKIPGMSVGFIKNDFMWAKGYGYADLENKSPATEKSMYRLASVTKPMTATAILQLVDNGKLNLDDEVQKYVPYFPKKKYPVTARYLLGHLGGISHYKDYSAEGHFKEARSTKESLAVFQDWDLVAEPGTRFNYTSYGYNLLGAVIEGASGMPYAEYMRKFVWDPLGMETIVMDDPRALIPNRVRGYEIGNGRIRNSEYVDISSRFAAGGTRASVIDMLKFGKGTYEGKTLSPDSLLFMFESMVTKSGAKTFYGAGIRTYPVNGRYGFSHSGSQQETATYLYIFPSRKLVIAVAMNLEGANRMPFVSKLFEAVTGEAWEVKPYGVEPNLFRFMQSSFLFGRSYFERFGKSAVSDAEFAAELSRMMRRISSTDEDLGKKLQIEASRPGSSFEKIGSFMAARLAESKGIQGLNSYSDSGCISFFADYISYSESKGFSSDKKISKDLAKKIKAYNKSWSRTNTRENNSIRFSPTTDISSLSAGFVNTFAGESVYPDLSNEIAKAGQAYATGGDISRALQTTKLGVDLYPMSDETNANHGILLILSGQKEMGAKALRRSVSINPLGTASPQGLVQVAGQLFQIGMYPQGLQMLLTADEIHPSNATVLYRIGDYYRRAKNKAKAIEYFKESLAVDPDFEDAKKDLKELMGTD